ncbi:MAG: lipopolysaccharide kinase InaA family protein [Azoarcus sp.]|nr:lipopolysaccharide kinase InaA family protein [Azoarcus sp.]
MPLEASGQTPVLTAAGLAAARRNLPLPCALRLGDGGSLDLLRSLRVLPGKRITGEGIWNGQRVLAKLFIASGSARHWRREHKGIALLEAAGIPTTPILAAGALADGGHYLLTAFLPDACSLANELKRGGDAHAQLEAVCTRLGQLHACGLVHGDPHPGNFLLDAGEPLVIDGDAVRRSSTPLSGPNADAEFAHFLAGLPPEKTLDALIAAYCAGNPRHTPSPAALRTQIEKYRRAQLTDYLHKTVRPCTLFEVRRSARRFTSVGRDDAAALAPLLADPDRAIASGVLLKNGYTATIARVEINGRMLAVKRYNIKNAAHALSRAWRPSRAWHSWREGHRLHFLGIATPMPRALIEERIGPMRRRAWLVTDHNAGCNLLEHLAPHVDASAPPPAESEALPRFFATLHAHRIAHGDLKANNLLWDEAQGVVVIDLDAMTQYTSAAAHARAWRRDRARLLANWPKDSGLHRWLDEHLPPAKGRRNSGS